MPQLKYITAKDKKIYPISITAGIYDLDNNQRLPDTLAGLKTAALTDTDIEDAAKAEGLM